MTDAELGMSLDAIASQRRSSMGGPSRRQSRHQGSRSRRGQKAAAEAAGGGGAGGGGGGGGGGCFCDEGAGVGVGMEAGAGGRAFSCGEVGSSSAVPLPQRAATAAAVGALPYSSLPGYLPSSSGSAEQVKTIMMEN